MSFPFPSLPVFSLPLPSLKLPPVSAGLIRAVDQKVPMSVKRRLVEPLLNRTFAEPLAEGEFDALEGRRVTLAIDDLGMALTLTQQGERMKLSAELGEATIRGGWREFLCLATRREDPDGLFFQRRLLIEGDTELGLLVKNLLDGREEGLVQGPFGELLMRLEQLAQHSV
ncbi:MAG: ubiquinone anaerobic biosynthesis accessory factor UbiT [Halomonas sp.]|uniref:ubiquinone anaerobic biosynthesis accessory factor UbiT n=1 Tax=Halomonas sp. TaxID=1486246 RepID=UPI003F8DBC2F